MVTTMTKNAIRVENLFKQYPNFCLDHLNFTVPTGSIVGFVGENGAGKTTTMKSILGIIQSKGLVEILGMNMKEHEVEIKQQIGVVFDENHFHESFIVKEVESVMKKVFHNWDSELFDQYLIKFKLPKNKRIKEFSRGMKMKLSIAVALAHHPKLLILDEATSGLDPIVREEILDIFLEFIQDDSHSILFSSHITSDLDKIADYVIFIHDGKIIFNKEKNELIETSGILKCGKDVFEALPKAEKIRYRQNGFGYEVLVNRNNSIFRSHPEWIIDTASIEDVMLFMVRGKQVK